MYKSSLRHIHDPVLSSLKMKGLRLLYFAFCILSLFSGIDVSIGHTCNTMRVKHDTIITCATADFFCLYLCSPTPSTTCPHTCAYVTRIKDNVSRNFEPRHVIPDTRISSGQCPRCDVNGT
jgi:hypothetical protein